MPEEEAGLEVMGCCLGLFALFTVGSGALIAWALNKARIDPAHSHLIRLMVEFVIGSSRDAAAVSQIHAILLRTFLHDDQYEELTTAVASFVPGGTAPFLDEDDLAEVFRDFLRRRRIVVPEYPPEQAGVWPPAPRR